MRTYRRNKSSAQSASFADFWGEEQEASALESKNRGREGSIKSQQKFDFFCYDITPYLFHFRYQF